jgi:LAS superfamily LD-carboxypeptidase LdcB
MENLLLGRARERMVEFGPTGICVHPDVAAPLRALIDAAAGERIAIEVASGFRDFDRQLQIWNQKARGERPVLDEAEHPLDVFVLSPEQRVFAILRWSALPGASRHHWGTDVDVFDRSALSPGAAPLLARHEATLGGIFGRLHTWLDDHARRHGFFRPYANDRAGVSPEPWHLSYAPLARTFEDAHSLESLERALRGADLELKDQVLRHLEAIFERYVRAGFMSCSSQG